MVKKFEGVGKPRLAAMTSLFGLLGSQDEFLDPTGDEARGGLLLRPDGGRKAGSISV